jgi:hypothetical protein
MTRVTCALVYTVLPVRWFIPCYLCAGLYRVTCELVYTLLPVVYVTDYNRLRSNHGLSTFYMSGCSGCYSRTGHCF